MTHPSGGGATCWSDQGSPIRRLPRRSPTLPAWLSVKVLVEKPTTHTVIDALEEIGCPAMLETELRHARI
jgi:hypothetical protein